MCLRFKRCIFAFLSAYIYICVHQWYIYYIFKSIYFYFKTNWWCPNTTGHCRPPGRRTTSDTNRGNPMLIPWSASVAFRAPKSGLPWFGRGVRQPRAEHSQCDTTPVGGMVNTCEHLEHGAKIGGMISSIQQFWSARFLPFMITALELVAFSMWVMASLVPKATVACWGPGSRTATVRVVGASSGHFCAVGNGSLKWNCNWSSSNIFWENNQSQDWFAWIVRTKSSDKWSTKHG